MKVIAMIPARYAASRFPGKLMKDLKGKSVIVRTYEATVNTGLFDEVIVVTDSDIIYNEITAHNGKVMMSRKEHECGSDRIAEAVADMDADVVVNVQGDEPFTEKESLSRLIEVFKNDPEKAIDLASLKTPIYDWDDIKDPNVVKVITDQKGNALYFSRSPIPYPRDEKTGIVYYKHKGVYAFRKEALMAFSQWPMLTLEATEKIEAIRYLEYGRTIRMVETGVTGIEIDTPEDLEKAIRAWK